MKALLIYHDEDADGHTSGYLLQHSIKSQYTTIDTKGLRYTEPPLEDVQALLAGYDMVYITDCSLAPALMAELHAAGKLVWYDHHAYAITKSHELGYADAPGMRNVHFSATHLVTYYSDLNAHPGKDRSVILDIVELVNNYDTWQTEHAEWADSVAWQYYYRSMNKHTYYELLEKALQHGLLDKPLSYYLCIGSHIKSFANGYGALSMHIKSLQGHDVTVVNYMDSTLPYDDTELLLMFVIMDAKVKISLRSKTVDVSAIARQYGGGGHYHAAGFTLSLDQWHVFYTETLTY